MTERKLYRVPGFKEPQEILIGYDELMPIITELLAKVGDYKLDMESFECVRQALQRYAIDRMEEAQKQADREKSDRVRHL